MSYIARSIETTVQRLSGQFPALLVSGARQSGKTTLLQHLCGADRAYISLDDPNLLRLATDDPQLLLQRFPGDVLIDEIQQAPDLLPLVKLTVDRSGRMGQFWLTGSQQFDLMKGVSESLAGRVAVLELLPFSYAERMHVSDDRSPWYPGLESAPERILRADLHSVFAAIHDGGFPRLVAEPDLDIEAYIASYITTYLQRDVRDLLRVGDLRDFDRFLRACAARTAQMLNMSELARDVGVAVSTVKRWLSVLEASCQVLLLEPFYRNVGKRLVKTPKLYFLNTGLACFLTGWRSPETAASGAMAGPLFETYVVGEVLKSWRNQGRRPPLYYWRTKQKAEIGLLFDLDGQLYPAEVKLAASPGKPGAGWQSLQNSGFEVGKGCVICLCEQPFPLARGIDAVPVGTI